MSALAGRVGEYLRLRRALGFKLVAAGHLLPQFAAFCDAAGAQTITVQLAVDWARLPTGVQPHYWAERLGVVRGFARWMTSIDPATQVPPLGVFAAPQPRHTPYIYTPQEIAALMQAARRLEPPLRAASYEALLGLLAATGMRVSEALTASRGDVDLAAGIITVRHAKLGRQRILPLHPSVTDALTDYAAQRDRLCPAPRCDAFFLSTGGVALTLIAAGHTFTRLTTWTGLRTATCSPRMHDLRHAMAVRTLIDWYRHTDNRDGRIDALLPLLSTYLGHVSPASTFWYLTAVPELMQLAAAQLPERAGRIAGADS